MADSDMKETGLNLKENGFMMAFPNGNVVSVRWGPGNYSSNKDEMPQQGRLWASRTAEVAAWRDIRPGEVPTNGAAPNRMWHTFKEEMGDHVCGWMPPEKVAEFIHFVANNELDTRKWIYDYDKDELVLAVEKEG